MVGNNWIGTNRKVFCCALFFAALGSASLLAQQATAPATPPSGPSGTPGVYIQDTVGWRLLAQNMQYKGKVKHGFVSGLTYGAVAAPMVVEYPGVHAAVQINATQPQICVSHILFPGTPLLVHLKPKKQKRELDSGSLRAVPLVGASKEAQASASSLVLTNTLPSTPECMTLLQPQAALAPGEYGVMMGAQNVAIMDFGVEGQ